MTTRDSAKRKTTPKAGRTRPIRKGTIVKSNTAPRGSTEQTAASMDEAVAQAVQSSYDVFDEAIRNARTTSDRLREGDLTMNALPVDVASISLKAIDIARQLSTATLDLCEQMVTQINTAAAPPPPGEVAAKVPPFRKTTPDEPEKQPDDKQPDDKARGNFGHIHFETHFTGGGKAVAHTAKIAKPQEPKKPSDLAPLSLDPAGFDAKGLKCEAFTMDLDGTLSVNVKVPKGQKAGFYNGLIMAKGQDVPLGVMSVEVLKSS